MTGNAQADAMLYSALAEKNKNCRYTLLNSIAESLKNSESLTDRAFASVCYELNGESYAALRNTLSLSSKALENEAFFANTCIQLQRQNIESAKESFRKAVDHLHKAKNYSELGLLIKIQKSLLQKMHLPENSYFNDIELPHILVIKSFTPFLTESFSDVQLQTGQKKAADLAPQTAHVLSCGSNMQELQMLEFFIRNGIKTTCVPPCPALKLFSAAGEEIGGKIAAVYQQSELLLPVTEYTPQTDIWHMTENYSARYLLGLAILEREETELPIVYIWSDHSNNFFHDDIKKICENNAICNHKIG